MDMCIHAYIDVHIYYIHILHNHLSLLVVFDMDAYTLM